MQGNPCPRDVLDDHEFTEQQLELEMKPQESSVLSMCVYNLAPKQRRMQGIFFMNNTVDSINANFETLTRKGYLGLQAIHCTVLEGSLGLGFRPQIIS